MTADEENRFRPRPGRIRSDAPRTGKTKSFFTQAKKIARQHTRLIHDAWEAGVLGDAG